MQGELITNGRNVTFLKNTLLQAMDEEDANRVIDRAIELVKKLPEIDGSAPSTQGLMLGLIQSGKTAALTTSIALAADNQYRFFIVLTTDNNWLYDQTLTRLQTDLQGIRVAGKDFELEEMLAPLSLASTDSGIVFVLTKNSRVLTKFEAMIRRLNSRYPLPVALIIDDEADQASLDVKNSKRAKYPGIEAGPINDLITRIRGWFPRHTFLQVTATPQALFLQDDNDYRPEFTIILEPGKGYVGGNTFFSIIEHEEDSDPDIDEENTSGFQGQSFRLIRYIDQADLDTILDSPTTFVPLYNDIPRSLVTSLAVFFVGATIKYMVNQGKKSPTDLVFSYLCHISGRINDHERASAYIDAYYRCLAQGLSPIGSSADHIVVENDLRNAYIELATTIRADVLPSFEYILTELSGYIVSTNIQILNSDKEQGQPNYTRRYNLLIGGTKLARGVTIKNLLVTYYGRQSRTTNMDTMLQHARMYGYRQSDLDVTRLFVTRLLENRFRLITESEVALRKVVQGYPNQKYQTIYIGPGVRAARHNVLNPNNIGVYAAGSAYFPKRPVVEIEILRDKTREISEILDKLYPSDSIKMAVPIDIERMIDIALMPVFDTTAGGLWDGERIRKALLSIPERSRSTGYIVVRRDRDLGPSRASKSRGLGELGSVLAGGSDGKQGLIQYGRRDAPTLYMLRSKARKWLADDITEPLYYWIPVVQFPEGQYALTFNIDEKR